MPDSSVGPLRAILRRVAWALLVLLVAVVIVYLGRGGYGDIVPVSDTARLINILVILPLRILFVIILVGTALVALTDRSRQAFKIQRWRSKVRDHVVVVGYGTKGRSAVAAVLSDGTSP